MTEIPTWWLTLTGIFAGLSIVVLIFQAVLIGALIKLIAELQPKITSIAGKVQGIADRVESISERVESIADSAKGVADTAKNTADTIGGKAKRVATDFQGLASSSAQKIEDRLDTATPILVYGKIAIDLLGALLEMRNRKKQQAVAEVRSMQ